MFYIIPYLRGFQRFNISLRSAALYSLAFYFDRYFFLKEEGVSPISFLNVLLK